MRRVNLYGWRQALLRSYQHSTPISYPRGEKVTYLARFYFKDGGSTDLSFHLAWNEMPYKFLLHFIDDEFVKKWVLRKEVQLTELFTGDGEYFESYEPIGGWFKRKEMA